MKKLIVLLALLLGISCACVVYIYNLYVFEHNFRLSQTEYIETEYAEPEWCQEAREILMRSNPKLSRFMADVYVDYIEAGVRDFAHIAEVDPLVVVQIIACESNARFSARNTYPNHVVRGPMQVSDVHVKNLKDAGIIKTERDLYGPQGITSGIFILASYRKSYGENYIIKYSGGAKYAEGF